MKIRLGFGVTCQQSVMCLCQDDLAHFSMMIPLRFPHVTTGCFPQGFVKHHPAVNHIALRCTLWHALAFAYHLSFLFPSITAVAPSTSLGGAALWPWFEEGWSLLCLQRCFSVHDLPAWSLSLSAGHQEMQALMQAGDSQASWAAPGG